MMFSITSERVDLVIYSSNSSNSEEISDPVFSITFSIDLEVGSFTFFYTMLVTFARGSADFGFGGVGV